ncbi:hypothetical protein CPC16_003716, partial [Podila verticillata]
MSSQAALASRALPRLARSTKRFIASISQAKRALSSSTVTSGKTYFPKATPKIQSVPRFSNI